VPQRGIGKQSLGELTGWAASKGISLYEALKQVLASGPGSKSTVSSRALNSMDKFYSMLGSLITRRRELPLLELFDTLIARSSYKDYLSADPEGDERWENIQELRSVAQQYGELEPGEALASFLERVSLVSDVDAYDENAQALLLSPDADYLDAVQASIDRLLPQMERAEIIAASLAGRGAMILTRDLEQAVDVSNRLAPEHLELSVADPEQLLPRVQHAGAIFMGPYTSEALGDYCAGPNHVLPTSRSARFSSPLGVYDFQKRSSVIMCSEEGVQELGRLSSVLARGESLTAHARSAELRLEEE